MRRAALPHLFLAAFAFWLQGCDRSPGLFETGVVEADRPTMAISDAAHGGNAHFYFLPPMVESPTFDGVFNAVLEPRVEICIWHTSNLECGVTLQSFSVDPESGSETVRVDESEEIYIVNWHTDNLLENHPLGGEEVYRVRVLVGDYELGFADVVVVSSGKDLKNYRTGDLIPLVDGRTLPIKFRIEEGVIPSGPIPLAFSVGWQHVCAVTADGDAYCWGGPNSKGELGSVGANSIPTLVVDPLSGPVAWASVSGGEQHTCGVTSDGRAYCWGSNDWYQIGNEPWADGSTPLLVLDPASGPVNWVSASAGYRHSCGLSLAGAAYCWGTNTYDTWPLIMYGTLGDGTDYPGRGTATAVVDPSSGAVTWVSVEAGVSHTCGLTDSGEAYCWGRNDKGQLGTGGTSDSNMPLRVADPAAGPVIWASVDVGYDFACGLTTDGQAYCWGINDRGQLGDGGGANRSVPVAVVDPSSGPVVWASISAGAFHACGMTNDGAGYCWGQGDNGQLGSGIGNAPWEWPWSPVPVRVTDPGSGPVKWALLSTGPLGILTCGATTSGNSYCWGSLWDDSGIPVLESNVPVPLADPF